LTEARHTLGARLKDARERSGVTLESIADATKINRSLLAGLERGDVSQWPKGIFRRAFVREYARALGLPAEEILTEFLREFPEDTPMARPDPAQPSSELRLTLGIEPHRRAWVAFRQVLAAMLDLGLVVLAGAMVAGLADENLWRASALVGLLYYPLSAAWLGCGLFGHWLNGEPRIRPPHRRRDMGVGAWRPEVSFRVPHPDNVTDMSAQHRTAT
jgi:transcriptional regulator with XRE-family HTH domain